MNSKLNKKKVAFVGVLFFLIIILVVKTFGVEEQFEANGRILQQENYNTKMKRRTISILAPVVPTQLESMVPKSRSPTLILGEPARSPSSVILPDTQNRPNNKTINVR